MFACATNQGFFIAKTHPLEIVARREFSSIHGGLSDVSLIDDSSLLILVGGGRVPRYAPNKVILWDEEATRSTPVQEKDEIASSSSEGTASPLASTVVSVEMEKEGNVTTDDDNIGTEDEEETIEEKTCEKSVKLVDGEEEILLGAEMPDEDGAARASASVIMSSSAHMDDPFGAPTAAPAIEDMSTESASKNRKRRKKPKEESAAEEQSVSHPTRKGREVAELEFGEAIRGICVRTFVIRNSGGEETSASSTTATLLVVVLNSRAVIFEMGADLASKENDKDEGTWSIRQRMVVEIQSGLKRGLASLAPIPGSNCALLALPGRQTGHVQLLSIALSNTSRTSIRSSIAGASTIIAAHANAISSLTLSDNGRMLCTTSERGTLLRIWSTLSPSPSSSAITLAMNMVGELRRGSDSAKIWSVAFSPDSSLLAAGSDKGTIHFFNLNAIHQIMTPSSSSPRSASPNPNATTSSPASDTSPTPSSLSKKANKYLPSSLKQITKSIPPSLVPQYLKSQWSFTQFKVPLKVFSSSNLEDSHQIPQSFYDATRRQQSNTDTVADSDHFMASGKQTSLEGNWAGMRGRIDDVRKGERGIEEGMWLTWIPATHAEQQKQPPSEIKSASIERTTSKRPTQNNESCPFELIAITSSGSHYRIGVSLPKEESGGASANKSGKATVLNMYKESSSPRIDTEDGKVAVADDEQQCWLIEYQRFGMRDDWNE
ncbi:hypothetical protein CBS101457_000997 [Exobasidium rhododendri]|nr:hypothetical protein CBS101457_000997 [Exobasidium rhododendri]